MKTLITALLILVFSIPSPIAGGESGSVISPAGLDVFLHADPTDQHVANENYMCLQFATDLAANAKSAGIEARVVAVVFVDYPLGHALVEFQTTRGSVYIDPSRGDVAVIAPEIGQPLCTVAGECWTWPVEAFGVYQYSP
jgi:hypothetical protein